MAGFKAVKDNPGWVWVPVAVIQPGMCIRRWGSPYRVEAVTKLTYTKRKDKPAIPSGRFRITFTNNTVAPIEAAGVAEYIVQESSIPTPERR